MELLGDVDHVESRSVHLEMVFVLVQERCTVCAEHTIGSEIILDAPVVLLGDEAQLEASFGPFGDSMYSAPDGAGKSFWTHPMELLGDVGHVESHSVRLEKVLVLVQQRCMVCAKTTICSDILLDAPDGTPR